jgi:hypothetical protein
MTNKSAEQLKKEKWRLFGIFPVAEAERQFLKLQQQAIETYTEFVDELKTRMKIFVK